MNSQPEDFKPELFQKIFGEEAAVSLYAEFKANSEFLLGEEGDLIFEKGGTPENVFLILDGYLRLQVKNSSAEEVILQFFGTGDLVGIIDLMQMRTYRATAVVHSKNIRLCVINKKSFFKILSNRLGGRRRSRGGSAGRGLRQRHRSSAGRRSRRGAPPRA